MAKKIVCIEIGTKFTRIAETTAGKRIPQVFNCITFSTPEGSVEDGYIRDKGTLAAVIRQKLQELKIKTTDVRFTLSSTKIASREVYVPDVSDSKIKSILRMQASEYLPIDMSEYTLAFFHLDSVNKPKKDSDKKVKVQLLAAPNSLVQSYYNLASALGMHVESIDYIGNSFYQLAKRQLGQGVNISIHINESTTIINIVENESLLLQRMIAFGADKIIERVKENQLFKSSTDEEAIEILCKEKLINYQFDLKKEDIGISYTTTSESYESAIKEMRAKEDVTDSFRFLMNHVIRVIDYFTAKNSDKKIGYIYLSGLGARFQGVVHLFKNELGYDVRRMENLFSASFVNKNVVPADEQPDYMSCIGATLNPVNFELEGQVKKDGALKGDLKNYIGVFAFFASLSFGVIVLCIAGKLTAEKKNRSLKDDIERLSSIEVVYKEHDTAVQKYSGIMDMYSMTESKVQELDKVIEDLEKKLPRSMTVLNLNATSTGVKMTIKTNSKTSVAKMIMSLNEIKYIRNVSVTSIVEDISTGAIVDQFSVSFDFCEEVDEEETADDGNQEADNTEQAAETEE